ncbi:unnamed protein product [Cochlearia groenlandica]
MKEVSKEKENPDGLEKLVNEGSAARTRPTSVEEIMRRRKAKESLENKKEETVGAAQVLEKGNDVVEKDSAYQESEKGYDRSKKGSREERGKNSSRKKEDTISSSREERLDKPVKEDHVGEVTDRDRFGVDTNMNAKRESPAAKKTDKQFHPQETGRKQARSALENLPGSRKRLRSLVVADIPQEEVRLKSDIGNKRKNQNGDHKKNKDRNMSKGHDRGKVHSDEVSDRWKKREQPKSHEHEMREKRKRSRSRDYGQDRHKRSSPLPKTEKVASRRKKEHEELSENAVKDRLGKHHYNDNENKGESTANNKSRRYSDSKSEVGGYSPRKRREDASVKTAKWDLAPTVTASMFPDSNSSGLQAATQTEHPTVSVASLTVLKPLMEVPFRTPTARQVTSGDSVQLTESTRRMRRLYAENVPDSASEKSLIECLNGYMLSSGSNHIKGSEPCISCIINKEKSQALVEFLTPQDASAALSLDGCSFAGSYLKFRRPKDYVEATSDELEKKEPATNVLSDNVEDSSNKIFIGGFPKAISSEMIMEIVSVFGPLKAYRFVISNDLNQRCAFLEYTDGSVTLKACAGLNGMKLGGSVITAVCAYPDASSIAVNENPPFYGIPKDAKPLLGKPKHVLKLKNVVDPEDLSSLSEPEMKEILEDVRLECARFGVIKSVNIVEHQSKDITDSETNASSNSKEMNVLVVQKEDKGSKKADEPCSDTPAETNPQANEDDESIEHCEKIVEEEVGPAPAQNQAENQQEELGSALAQDQAENPQEELGSARAVKTRWDTGDKKEEEQDPKDVFEPGCIFIEYGRPEAASDAAHSLHGRLYGDRTVKAEYVSKELYQIRFPSG